jgi:hypothetical protein
MSVAGRRLLNPQRMQRHHHHPPPASTPLHLYTSTPLHPFTPSPLHPYTPTPLLPFTCYSGYTISAAFTSHFSLFTFAFLLFTFYFLLFPFIFYLISPTIFHFLLFSTLNGSFMPKVMFLPGLKYPTSLRVER